MIPPLDVFALDTESDPRWLGSATDLREAEKLIQADVGEVCSKYFVLSQVTGHRTQYEVRSGQVLKC